jgi:pimeloyl-ACP methyl ester carboxylesterase
LTKELYIFSGLGADERVFQLLDFSGFSTTFVKWIVPQDNETIEQYATRLIDQITTTKPTLIGLSFGGLIAVEVAKQIDTEKVILIASAKTKNEIPFYYRFAGLFKMHRLLPTSLLKSSNFITNWFFGTSSTFDKQLLKQILIDTDPTFLKWAIDKVALWKNQTQTKNLFHIHGTSDRILPLSFVKCNSTINNGGHLMTLNKADELNSILRQQL